MLTTAGCLQSCESLGWGSITNSPLAHIHGLQYFALLWQNLYTWSNGHCAMYMFICWIEPNWAKHTCPRHPGVGMVKTDKGAFCFLLQISLYRLLKTGFKLYTSFY